MNYLVKHPTRILSGNVNLPASKSLSNRALIIQAICNDSFSISNLSTANDTIILQESLTNYSQEINIKDSGTAMRFLTALLAIKNHDCILTGNTEMNNRPIGPLVKALNSLGAKISYIEKENYPPIHIKKGNLTGGEIKINSNISSQFVSALLMIAPAVKGGLKISLEDRIVSSSYIKMTLDIMKYFGVSSIWKGNKIIIQEQKYHAKDIIIENDWSAAAFWMQLTALSKEANISLQGLEQLSWQGDKKALDFFKHLGVKYEFNENLLTLKKSELKDIVNEQEFDLLNNPDLAQPLICAFAGVRTQAKVTGIYSLRFKETNRIHALKKELEKIGVTTIVNNDSITLTDFKKIKTDIIKTYKDHRMAMSFAPLALVHDKIIIKDSEVVMKSYPKFWEDLRKCGFIISRVID